ncbi:hypothetical protein BU23DRAFT_598812 [Bimuria novae-zelandiae CBS 107.79]|uniref:Uncharacterized protein n=1 Tax=Bimuria novae-zelandiae CBS 107.79 TaxID=1447943 RepID=A0A6A5V8Z0_9PLEO|nr:hypothetical protein BU23DRAFT_598812 [Bimuria novae-zelandiae CBS 107.79]
MYFSTTLFTLALAAAGVSAVPTGNAGLDTRQTTTPVPGVVYVQFFNGSGCQENFVEDDVFFDDGTGVCRVEPFTGTYGSFRIVTNGATRPLTLYTRTDCTTTVGGNSVKLTAGETGCFSQRIGSGSYSA